ncbi:hypothetical protein V2G26_008396 [Clonostachys chloroleuca]
MSTSSSLRGSVTCWSGLVGAFSLAERHKSVSLWHWTDCGIWKCSLATAERHGLQQMTDHRHLDISLAWELGMYMRMYAELSGKCECPACSNVGTQLHADGLVEGWGVERQSPLPGPKRSRQVLAHTCTLGRMVWMDEGECLDIRKLSLMQLFHDGETRKDIWAPHC